MQKSISPKKHNPKEEMLFCCKELKHTADLSIISKLECSNRKTASTRIATKAIGAKRPCPKMQLRCQMTSLRHMGEKVPLDEHSSNARRVRRDTTLRKSQLLQNRRRTGRLMRGMASEEVSLLSLTNESTRSSFQESTGSSRSKSVLESHCRTTLGQRKNGATRKKLELEHRPKCSNQ